MPTRIYPIRPLRPRGYYGAQQASPYAGAFKEGSAFGSKIGAEIGKAMQANKLNTLANRLMNSQNVPGGAPRAALVAPGVEVRGRAAEPGTPGATPNVVGAGVPTAGTQPFSSGEAGLKLQQEFQKNQLANYLDQAKIANELRMARGQRLVGGGGGGGGGGGNASRWQQHLAEQGDQAGKAGKAGKPAAYQPGSSTVDTPNAYYNFNNQRADIDAQYGKGTYDRMLANAGNITQDPKTGKYGVKTTIDPDTGQPVPVSKDISVDPNTGDVTLKGSGQHAGAHIPFNDLQQNMTRYDGTLVQQGKQPRFSDQYLKTQNPQSGLPNGDAANPYAPQNNGQLDAIPPGKSYVDPTDGKVYQKQAPQKPAAQPPAKATSQVDTGDQSQQVASAQAPQTQMPSLLQPLPSGQSQTPQPGLAGGDQGTDYTGGGSSQFSPVVPQAPVDPMAVAASNTPGSFFPGAGPATGGLSPDVDLSGELARTQLASRLQGVA